MKVIQNRKEWRHSTVIKLIKLNGMSVGDAISEAKDLEKYVFQNEVIIDVGEITSSSPISKKNENQLFSINPPDANSIKRILGKKTVADDIKLALAEKRQHHLKGVLKDPLHGPHRIYRNAVRSYSESTTRAPLDVVLEDLAQINGDNQTQDNKPNMAGVEDTKGKQPQISGCMPIGSILYTESGSRIKLISVAQYQGWIKT